MENMEAVIPGSVYTCCIVVFYSLDNTRSQNYLVSLVWNPCDLSFLEEKHFGAPRYFFLGSAFLYQIKTVTEYGH